MAVTPFKFPRFSERQKMSKFPRNQAGVRTVVVDFSNNFLLTLQDILNVRKTAGNKIIIQIFAFFIILARLMCFQVLSDPRFY